MLRDFRADALKEPLDSRSKFLRSLILEALRGGGRGHLGPALSLLEIVRILYDEILLINPAEPENPKRDRFILSKGHGCLALYAVLSDKGFFQTDLLSDYCKFESLLGGHPELNGLPGIEFSTGALGHGLPVGVGFAVAARIKGQNWKTYVLMGDGELNEGSVWEAAMHAVKHQLNNLVVLIDANGMQASGDVSEVLPMGSLSDKLKSFGFNVSEVNGHSLTELRAALHERNFQNNSPSAIICHTIKGKGFKNSENSTFWHHRAKITSEDLVSLSELEEES